MLWHVNNAKQRARKLFRTLWLKLISSFLPIAMPPSSRDILGDRTNEFEGLSERANGKRTIHENGESRKRLKVDKDSDILQVGEQQQKNLSFISHLSGLRSNDLGIYGILKARRMGDPSFSRQPISCEYYFKTILAKPYNHSTSLYLAYPRIVCLLSSHWHLSLPIHKCRRISFTTLRLCLFKRWAILYIKEAYINVQVKLLKEVNPPILP